MSGDMDQRTLLAVDGNSLLHRSFHASARTGFCTADGRPRWAVRGLLSQLVSVVDRVCADAVVVGFDDRQHSVRRQRWPSYKGQRLPKPATLEEQLDAAVDILRDLGVVVVVPSGLEADDVLASAAAWAPTVGARTVVATSDRDSFALIDDHTRMLRILNGGVEGSPMLDQHRLPLVTGVRPDQYLDFAALRGDASDNLPGVPGFGPKTAARLLCALGTAEAAFEDAAAGGERCRAAVGAALARTLATVEAREVWELNCAAMSMHAGAELGLDLGAGRGCLPLDEDAVRATYQAFDLHVPSALRALAMHEPSQPRAVDVDASWRPPRVGSAQRFPPLPKPRPAPEPAYVQETLF
jgi:DNA polymerase-1